jgi:regulatory protein YycI of two-component signal transduction system YycFG
MEWGKVKTILILSFLCLNLLLGAQLWENRLKEFPLIPDEAAEQVEELLRAKGIVLRREIPKETPNVREISIQFQVQNGKRTELAEPVPIALSEERWRDRLKEYIPGLQEYAIDRTRSDERSIVLNQTFGGIPMFQVDLVLYVSEDRITSFSQSYAKVQPFRDQKEVPALSALRVLQVMAETKLKEGSVIEEIRLGYHGQLFDSDTQVLAPKWRITMENGDIYYVHAISGEME